LSPTDSQGNRAAPAPLILYAEDNSGDRELFREALGESGLEAELQCVKDGVALMRYLQRRDEYADLAGADLPRLIFLDLNMPMKNGQEALAELKGPTPLGRIPVVVLTTSGAEQDIRQCYDLGAVAYIKKPVSFERLIRIIKVVGEYWLDIALPPE